jgi:hypothetical protein
MNKVFLLFLIVIVGHAPFVSGEERDSFDVLMDFTEELSYNDVDEFLQNESLKEKETSLFLLKLTKRYILNGRLELAQYFLDKVDKKTKLMPVLNRYQSIIYFLRGDYFKSVKVMERIPDTLAHKRENCILMTMQYLVLDREEKLKTTLKNCISMTETNQENDFFWPELFSKLKLKDPAVLNGKSINSFRYSLNDNEFIRIWMKSAIYLNKEEIVIKLLKYLPKRAYSSPSIRELIGLIYYRTGSMEKSYSFVEDLNTPNAENIKGNINLQEKKYELAFGHFKLALNKKNNSLNALERVIPLAWILGLWDEGLSFIKYIDYGVLKVEEVDALRLAFNIRKGDLRRSTKLMNLMQERFGEQTPLKIDLMSSYLSLLNFNQDMAHEFSHRACKKFDAINCFIKNSLLTWENFGKTINRDELVFSSVETTLEDLKSKKEIRPILEELKIDPSDIDELDAVDLGIGPSIKKNLRK